MTTPRYDAALGIDPGVTGAIAYWSRRTGLIVWDMPVTDGGAKRELDIPRVADILDRHIATIFLERQIAMPKQGVTSTFTTGYNYGKLISLCEMLNTWGNVCHVVRSQTWKPAVGIRPGSAKSASREAAINYWHGYKHLFERAKDHGRADAALILAYGLYHYEAP